MILAAGLGTRMLPLTRDRPKALLEVAGRPMIDHVLDRLAAAGVREAVVNLHAHADLLAAHLAGRTAPRILTLREDRLLDTGGGVRNALGLLGRRPFFLLNADIVWLDGPVSVLHRLAQMWDDAAMDLLLALAPTVRAHGFGLRDDLTLDQLGRVGVPAQRRMGPFVNTGIQVIHPRIFDGMPEGPFSILDCWGPALRSGRLRGLAFDGVWMHVGSPAALAEADGVMAGLGWRWDASPAGASAGG